jgi:hypothetical protein
MYYDTVHFRANATVKSDVIDMSRQSAHVTKVFSDGNENDCCPLLKLARQNQGAFFRAKETWGDLMDFAGQKH